MALSWSTITATTREVFVKKLVDNIYDESALLKILMMDESVKMVGGRKVVEPIKYAKTTAVGAYSGYDTFDMTPPDHITAAEFNWGRYYATVSISGEEEDENKGEAAVLNLLSEKVDDARMALKDKLGDDIYAGTDTKGIIGLASAVDSADTYGGIAVADFSGWAAGEDSTSYTRAQLEDSSQDNYIHKLFQAADRSCLHLGRQPNLIVTTPLIWDIYESTLAAQQRFLKTKRGQKIADAGFDVLEWRSRPVVKDEKCTAGSVFFLNTEFMKLRIDPNKNFKFTGFKEPTNQDARAGQILFKGQVCLNNRRMHYKFTGFPTS